MSDTPTPDSTTLFPPAYQAPVVPDAAAPACVPEAPRARWAAIIWGAVFAITAAIALWVTVSPGRREAVADWIVTLSPMAAAAYMVLVVGAVALVAGVVGLARRAQRAFVGRRSGTGVDAEA
jgi:apolipoprotein N-acyltransferase